ncbi:hypothetical protein Bbelb_367590 [Branchiostoma belcheri]|nr:hypothetical protein Bbelb_367590 [Branchiostoma belcheri]
MSNIQRYNRATTATAGQQPDRNNGAFCLPALPFYLSDGHNPPYVLLRTVYVQKRGQTQGIRAWWEDTMGRKLRHLLVFLLIILEEINTPSAGSDEAGIAIFATIGRAVWYKRRNKLGLAVGNNTNTIMASGHDQTGQGQSQANIQTINDPMENKLRHLLIFLIFILKEINTPSAGSDVGLCNHCRPWRDCHCSSRNFTTIPQIFSPETTGLVLADPLTPVVRLKPAESLQTLTHFPTPHEICICSAELHPGDSADMVAAR